MLLKYSIWFIYAWILCIVVGYVNWTPFFTQNQEAVKARKRHENVI